MCRCMPGRCSALKYVIGSRRSSQGPYACDSGRPCTGTDKEGMYFVGCLEPLAVTSYYTCFLVPGSRVHSDRRQGGHRSRTAFFLSLTVEPMSFEAPFESLLGLRWKHGRWIELNIYENPLRTQNGCKVQLQHFDWAFLCLVQLLHPTAKQTATVGMATISTPRHSRDI